ncbi:MAG: hypothetical protein AB1757_15855 [Acidobacteriota bacterium]
MTTIDEFQSKMGEGLERRGLRIDQWTDAPRRSKHLLKIDTTQPSTILYVKEGNGTKAFWGITKNQIERLNQASIKWFAILLLNSSNAGYVFSSEDMNKLIGDCTLSQGDYKVNNPKSKYEFKSIEDLLNRIL